LTEQNKTVTKVKYNFAMFTFGQVLRKTTKTTLLSDYLIKAGTSKSIMLC